MRTHPPPPPARLAMPRIAHMRSVAFRELSLKLILRKTKIFCLVHQLSWVHARRVSLSFTRGGSVGASAPRLYQETYQI
jgi:hypothetical protein